MKKILSSIIKRRDCVIYPEEIFDGNNYVEYMSSDTDSNDSNDSDEDCNYDIVRDISNNDVKVYPNNIIICEKEKFNKKCPDYVLNYDNNLNQKNWPLGYDNVNGYQEAQCRQQFSPIQINLDIQK